MPQEAPRRVGQSQPYRAPARLRAAQESDGAAAEGRSQPQLRQPRPGSARRSHDVRGEGAHPRQYRVRNSVTGSSPCRNIRRPDTALNETKNPPSDEPPLLLEDLRKPLDIPRKAPCRPQTNDMVERSSLRVDLRPHLHNQPQREATFQTRLHHNHHRPGTALGAPQPHSQPRGEARLDTQQIADPKKQKSPCSILQTNSLHFWNFFHYRLEQLNRVVSGK